jgi:hypothetical protein
MVASEVAVATSIADSDDTPKLWNKKNSTGTMTIPPPTPNRPAKIPANIPVPTNAKKVGILFVINSMILIRDYFYFSFSLCLTIKSNLGKINIPLRYFLVIGYWLLVSYRLIIHKLPVESSLRTISAPALKAFSFPLATSRDRGAMPQLVQG